MITGPSRAALAGVLLALSVCASGAVTGDAAGRDWGLETLMQRLAQVKTAKARFVERKHLRILDAPLETSGTLSYSFPGRLEKHTTRPRPETLILDEDRLTITDGVRKSRRTLVLQDYPVLWAFVESIRSTLAGDLNTLNRFYRVELHGAERDWRLTLTPREDRMRAVVSEIRIGGTQSSVRTIEVVETGGDRSIMTISEGEP